MKSLIAIFLLLTSITLPAALFSRLSSVRSLKEQHLQAKPTRQQILEYVEMIAAISIFIFIYTPESNSRALTTSARTQARLLPKDKSLQKKKTKSEPDPQVEDAKKIWAKAEAYYKTLHEEKLKQNDSANLVKDPYQIFKILPETIYTETEESLNSRKKELLRLSHPDRVSSLDEEIIKTATTQTQLILWAYEQLLHQLKNKKSVA